MGCKLLLFLTVTHKQFNASQAGDIWAMQGVSCEKTSEKDKGGKLTQTEREDTD